MINFNPFFGWDFSILFSHWSKAEQWSYLDGQTYKIHQGQANWMPTKIMQTQSPLCLGHFASRSFQFFLQPLSSHCNHREVQQPSPLAPPLAFLSLHSTHTDLQNTAPFSGSTFHLLYSKQGFRTKHGWNTLVAFLYLQGINKIPHFSNIL